jgi:hypothetical protein
MRLISNTLFNPFRRALTATVLLMTVSLAHAQAQQNRILPADSYQVRIDEIAPPMVTIDGTTVQIAAGSLIFTGDGRTITSNNLTAGTLVRVEFNFQCQIKKIWVLNDDEIIPRPWYFFVFRPDFVPPC